MQIENQMIGLSKLEATIDAAVSNNPQHRRPVDFFDGMNSDLSSDAHNLVPVQNKSFVSAPSQQNVLKKLHNDTYPVHRSDLASCSTALLTADTVVSSTRLTGSSPFQLTSAAVDASLLATESSNTILNNASTLTGYIPFSLGLNQQNLYRTSVGDLSTCQQPNPYLNHQAFAGDTLRRGKWTLEEEQYANLLIEEFENGAIQDCDNGCTLRAYLSRKLHCAPMRVSKKFAGQSIGKYVFLARSTANGGSTPNVDNSKKLKQLECNFHLSLLQGSAGLQNASRHYNQPISTDGFYFLPLINAYNHTGLSCYSNSEDSSHHMPGVLPPTFAPNFAHFDKGVANQSHLHGLATQAASDSSVPTCGEFDPTNLLKTSFLQAVERSDKNASAANGNVSYQSVGLSSKGVESVNISVSAQSIGNMLPARHGEGPKPVIIDGNAGENAIRFDNQSTQLDTDNTGVVSGSNILTCTSSAQLKPMSETSTNSDQKHQNLLPDASAVIPSKDALAHLTQYFLTSSSKPFNGLPRLYDQDSSFQSFQLNPRSVIGENSSTFSSSLNDTSDQQPHFQKAEPRSKNDITQSMPQPPLMKTEAPDCTYGQESDKDIDSADAYVIFVQQSAFAASQHSAYCRNETLIQPAEILSTKLSTWKASDYFVSDGEGSAVETEAITPGPQHLLHKHRHNYRTHQCESNLSPGVVLIEGDKTANLPRKEHSTEFSTANVRAHAEAAEKQSSSAIAAHEEKYSMSSKKRVHASSTRMTEDRDKYVSSEFGGAATVVSGSERSSSYMGTESESAIGSSRMSFNSGSGSDNASDNASVNSDSVSYGRRSLSASLSKQKTRYL